MEKREIPDDIKERIDEYDRNLDRWTYYELLYTTRDATPDQLKKAYRRMVALMHPDKYGYNLDPEYKEKLERIFNEINTAYNTLADEAERIKYDQNLYYSDDHGKPHKVDTDTQVAQAQYARGIQALKKKEYKVAIEFFNSAINLDGDRAEYYAKLAYAKIKQPNPRIKKEAIAACREAIKLNQENANYHALMGFIYKELGDLDTAEVHYRRALSWNPHHQTARKELKNIAFLKQSSPTKGLLGKLTSFLKPKSKQDTKKLPRR